MNILQKWFKLAASLQLLEPQGVSKKNLGVLHALHKKKYNGVIIKIDNQ